MLFGISKYRNNKSLPIEKKTKLIRRISAAIVSFRRTGQEKILIC